MASHNEQVLNTISKLQDSIKDVIDAKISWVSKIEEITKLIVPEVETIGQGWKGSEKKELAQAIIVDAYWKYSDVKYVPNVIENLIVTKLAGFLIDRVVKIFNKIGIFTHAK